MNVIQQIGHALHAKSLDHLNKRHALGASMETPMWMIDLGPAEYAEIESDPKNWRGNSLEVMGYPVFLQRLPGVKIR